jgi:hypothetical protein
MRQFIITRFASQESRQTLRLITLILLSILVALFFSSCSIIQSLTEGQINPYVTQHITLDAERMDTTSAILSVSVYQPKPLLVEQTLVAEITTQGAIFMSYATKAHEARLGWPAIIAAIGSAIAGWIAHSIVKP